MIFDGSINCEWEKASQAVRGQKTFESWTNISIFHFHAENKIYDRYTSVANKSPEDK